VDTAKPASQRYNADPINQADNRARSKKNRAEAKLRPNYQADLAEFNAGRRETTKANRKLKPCKVANMVVADLPTDHHRASFAKARKTCLGKFYPKGKTETCSDPCSKALEKLSHYWRQKKSNKKNKAKISATKKKRRARNKAAGRGRDVGAKR
jgi:hypothetical protein